MDIRTATTVAIAGVSISLISGAVVLVMQYGNAGLSLPVSYHLARAGSILAFLGLHVGLLVFLVVLYRRQ